MNESPVVRLEKDGEIGVVIVNYPPVNALGPGVSDGIIEALSRANADPAIKAMVLMGEGRSFIAGADIRGFGTGRKRPPLGQRTYDVLDASPKPVVAAIHGYALGGGLENALACHYRIAGPSAKVGLPEVLIGILPGGGGTQRLPRVVGAQAALELITSGRHVPAPEAAGLGIIDEVLPANANLRAAAVAYARKIADIRPLPRVRDRNVTACSPSWKTRTRQRPCAMPSSPNAKSPSCRTCPPTSNLATSRHRPLSAPAPWVAASPWPSPTLATT
jgi:3-hydroxyacyl-CoA dehydrogenase